MDRVPAASGTRLMGLNPGSVAVGKFLSLSEPGFHVCKALALPSGGCGAVRAQHTVGHSAMVRLIPCYASAEFPLGVGTHPGRLWTVEEERNLSSLLGAPPTARPRLHLPSQLAWEAGQRLQL